MQVHLGKEKVTLADRDLLGAGGEASVYRWRDRALKVFHPIDPALCAPDRARLERALELKAQKLRRFPSGLPAEVVAPLELCTDGKGALLGYAMPLVEGAEDVLRLGQRRFREGAYPNADVTQLFRRLHGALEGLHRRGVVVGDFNDSNVLFQRTRPFLIDADSMQFEGLPCVVGHERFLDPRLYGVDLAAAPAFSPGSDWFSFAVMLFSSLLYVHPYGGMHDRHPTLLRRAEARASVLRPQVRYPKAAVHYRVLPDELLGWFERVFEKDERSPFPPRLLELEWSRCRCGAEHARGVCPECAQVGPPSARQASRHNGRCSAHLVFRTRGRLLRAAMQGGLRYAFEEDGVLFREDGGEVLSGGLPPTARVALCGPSTWVGEAGRLLHYRGGKVVDRTGCGTFGLRPSFDASARACVRADGEWLVDAQSGQRLGKALEGSTWFRVGEALGFGFYRVGLVWMFFLFRPGRAGVVQVALPSPRGRLVDAAAVFDEGHVLFSVATELDGVRRLAVYLVDGEGKLLGVAEGRPEESRVLASVRGKALLGGRVVAATEEGLLSVRAEGGRLVEGTLFTDTQPFVGADVELLPGAGGSIYVVGAQEITQLTLR